MKITYLVFLSSLLYAFVSFGGTGETFRYSAEGAATTLDPVQSATKYSNMVVTAIFDTLYEYAYLVRPYAVKPNLAESMPTVSKDNLTYTIKIKKGVYFTDDRAFKNGTGRELVADDFVFSFKRHFDPATRPEGTWLWQNRIEGLDEWKEAGSLYDNKVEGLDALDRYTIQIKLKKPYPQLIYTLTMGYSAVAAREVVEKYGREITIHPVGSGPFMLEKDGFNTKRAYLLRNPKYRHEIMDLDGYDTKLHGYTGIKKLQGKQIPMLDRVEVHFMENQGMRWTSFTKGNEIQFDEIPKEQFENVIASKNPITLKQAYAKKYKLQSDPEFAFVYMNFNMDDSTIGYNKDPEREKRNKALRCAIRKAWNWRARIDRFYRGLGKPFPGIIMPGIDGYDPNLSTESITYDPEGAKHLLKEHGWNAKNLPVFKFSNVGRIDYRQMFEQLRVWLIDIGYPKDKIKADFFANFGDYNKAVKERKVMTINMAWSLDYPDSENVLQLYYGPNASPGSNSTNYNNPEYNKLYEQSSVMQPSFERTEIYKKMHKILIDDCATVAGFSRTKLWIWHKNVLVYPSENTHGNYFKYVDVE